MSAALGWHNEPGSSSAGQPAEYLSDVQSSAAQPATACREQNLCRPMHIKIKVIYGLGAEVHEFKVAAGMTLKELQGKSDEIHDHVSPAVKRYQFMAAGQLETLDITFELNNKIRDIADLFESAEIYLRALPLDHSEAVTDALAVAQVGDTACLSHWCCHMRQHRCLYCRLCCQHEITH